MVTIHGGCMLAGFLSMAAGAATAWLMKEKTWWLRVHRGLGSVGGICLLLGLTAALVAVSGQTGRHLAVPHSWLGLVTILSAVWTYTMGVIQLKKRTERVRSLHRWSGRITLALLLLNVLSGLSLTGLL